MSGSQPAVSIVVPVYKGVRYLRTALESVCAQTCPDWECVCVDDGSKDGSAAILDEFASRDPRFRVFHRENGGTSVARNFALQKACGRYIAFLDEDDAYHPRYLEVLLAAAERTGADVVGCEFLKFEDGTEPAFGSAASADGDWRVAEGPELAEWAAKYYEGVPFEVWRNLYRRETAAGHLFPPGVRVEQDLRWMYTLLPSVRKYARMDWAGYAWRVNRRSGGFLHPDAASLLSLTETDLLVCRCMAEKMGLTPEQLGRLSAKMSHTLRFCIWDPLHAGAVRPNRESSRLLRAGLTELAETWRVDIARTLRGFRRLRWRLFMKFGWRP